MPFHHWLTFLLATAFICATPGPNMLQMMTSGSRYGLKRTLYTMAGCHLAVLIMIGTSLVGVGAILKASPFLFGLLRIAGAAYLIYLGIQAWRDAGSTGLEVQTPVPAAYVSARQIFRSGFLVGISNPKALLFATAFFPQFIDPNARELPQLIILLGTFCVVEISCYTMYAVGGKQLAVFLTRATIQKLFHRVTGSLFIAFGALLVAARS